MINSLPNAPARPANASRMRFSLQTLFFVSFLLVSPFFAAAFASGRFNADYAAVAPILVVIGAVLIGIATMVGYSLGNRRGAFIGALAAGGLWVGLAALGLASIVLISGGVALGAFLLHSVAAIVCTGVVCLWLRRQKEPEERATDSATFARLRSVKQAALDQLPHDDKYKK